jgi:FkbM family methyltransferase
MDQQIWAALLKAERKARGSKWKRLLQRPVLYPALMIYDYVIYPRNRKSISLVTDTFFGIPMKTLLPSGTDIRLHKIKAHDSEIRFAKFLVRQLNPGDTFIDIGAHYGYYSLLAEALVGPSGQIFAIEASSTSAEILKENTTSFSNVRIIQAAASDVRGHITFYEYPVPYAECNTTVKDAYKGERWIQHVKEIENKVPTVLVDDLMARENITSATFKIDAEGGETAVLRGMVHSLRSFNLVVVMEYHYTPGKVSVHAEAARVLMDCGYQAHGIDLDGHTFAVPDIEAYLSKKGLESDNLVFVKG